MGAYTSDPYTAQRQWLHQMRRSTISALSEAFGGLSGQVAMRNKASAFYQECVCTVANDTLSFGNGLSLSLGDVLQVEADLLQFELKLSTAQGTVRVRTLSAQAMQMWMRVLPPSTYRNEHRKYAIPRNAECQEITVARRPAGHASNIAFF